MESSMQLWFQRYLDKTTDVRADYTSNGNGIFVNGGRLSIETGQR